MTDSARQPASRSAQADPAFPVLSTPRLLHQCLLALLVAMPFFLIRNMLAVYCEGVLKLPEGDRALIVGMLPFANMLFFMPMGLFSDWFSPRRLIQGGVAAYFLALAGMAFIQDIPPEWTVTAMTALVALFSAGWATLNSASASLFYKMIPKSDPGRDRKIALYAVCGAIGYGGPVLIRWVLSGQADPLAGIFTLAAVIAVGALLASIALPATPPLARDPVARYIADAKNPRVAWYLALNFAWSLHFGAELNCIGPYLKHSLGATDADVGDFFGLAVIPLALMPLMATWIEALARHRNKLLILALAVSGITNIYVGVAGSFAVFFLMRVPHLLSDGLFGTTARLVMNDIHDQRRVGGHLGMTTFVTILGAFLGSVASGAIGAALGDGHPWQHVWPFIVLGSAALVAAGAFAMSATRFPEPAPGRALSGITSVIAVGPAAGASPALLPLAPSARAVADTPAPSVAPAIAESAPVAAPASPE